MATASDFSSFVAFLPQAARLLAANALCAGNPTHVGRFVDTLGRALALAADKVELGAVGGAVSAVAAAFPDVRGTAEAVLAQLEAQLTEEVAARGGLALPAKGEHGSYLSLPATYWWHRGLAAALIAAS